MKILLKSIFVVVILQLNPFSPVVSADTPPDSIIKLYDQVLQQPGWISSYYVSVDSSIMYIEDIEPFFYGDTLITAIYDSTINAGFYDTTMYDTTSFYAKLELLNDSVGIYEGFDGIDTIDFVLVSQDDVLSGNGVFVKIVSAEELQLIFLDEHVDYIFPFISYSDSMSLDVSLDEIKEALLDGKWHFSNDSNKNCIDFGEKSRLYFDVEFLRGSKSKWELKKFDNHFVLMIENLLHFTEVFEIKEFSKSRISLINIRSKQKYYLIKGCDEK